MDYIDSGESLNPVSVQLMICQNSVQVYDN